MNKEQDIQKFLRGEYQEGPSFKMDDGVGINYFSGTSDSAYYELWGNKDIYRLIIMKPSSELFTYKYVGKNHILVLLVEEEEQTVGGFISITDELQQEFEKVFSHRQNVTELKTLWEEYVQPHYMTL